MAARRSIELVVDPGDVFRADRVKREQSSATTSTTPPHSTGQTTTPSSSRRRQLTLDLSPQILLRRNLARILGYLHRILSESIHPSIDPSIDGRGLRIRAAMLTWLHPDTGTRVGQHTHVCPMVTSGEECEQPLTVSGQWVLDTKRVHLEVVGVPPSSEEAVRSCSLSSSHHFVRSVSSIVKQVRALDLGLLLSRRWSSRRLPILLRVTMTEEGATEREGAV